MADDYLPRIADTPLVKPIIQGVNNARANVQQGNYAGAASNIIRGVGEGAAGFVGDAVGSGVANAARPITDFVGGLVRNTPVNPLDYPLAPGDQPISEDLVVAAKQPKITTRAEVPREARTTAHVAKELYDQGITYGQLEQLNKLHLASARPQTSVRDQILSEAAQLAKSKALEQVRGLSESHGKLTNPTEAQTNAHKAALAKATDDYYERLLHITNKGSYSELPESP